MNYFDILLARKLKGGGGEGYNLKTASGDIVTIRNGVALPMPSLTVGIEAVQSGSGDPSPTNVRPISGWSAVNVTRCGKNLIPYVEFGVLNQTDGSEEDNTSNKRTGFIRTLPNTQYTISGLEGSGISIRIFEYKKDKTYIGNYVASNITNSVIIQTGAEVGYIRFQGNETVFVSNVAQCEKGNQVTTYEPYSSTTYTTALKDGQGNPLTCYGGELSNVNGVQTLDNTHNSFDMGSIGWGYTNNRFFAKINDIWNNEQSIAPTENQLMCEIYKTAMYTNQPSGAVSTWSGYIYIRDDSYSGDATAFKTAVAGYKIAYELATTQTIPQDNLAIATQEGTNNLWADSGDIIECKYFEQA